MQFTAFDSHLNAEEKPHDEIPEGWTIDTVSDGEFEIDDLFGEAPSTYSIHSGNLSISENTVLTQADEFQLIIIDGDVVVDGVAVFAVWDLYRPVIITGSLEATSLVVSAETHLYVLGDVTVENAIIADLGDGGLMSLTGSVSAERMICGENGEVVASSGPNRETGLSLEELGGQMPELEALFEALGNQSFDVE